MRGKKRRLVAEINVVPYIDVMLVLLVIFMITTPLLTQGVKIDLPKAKAESLNQEQQQPLIVSVNAKGQYFLNTANDGRKALTPDELATRVAAQVQFAEQAKNSRRVLIKGSRDVAYGQVVQAMVLLQQAGVKSVGLMTDPTAARTINLAQRLQPARN